MSLADHICPPPPGANCRANPTCFVANKLAFFETASMSSNATATGGGASDATDSKRAHTQAAISQIRNRHAQLPSIDFTVHVSDDGKSYSTTERVVKDVQAPAFAKPTDEQFFTDDTRTKPDIAFLKNHFYREGRLTDQQVRSRQARVGAHIHARP